MPYRSTKPVFTKKEDGSFAPTEEAHLINDLYSMISGKPKSTISPYRIPEPEFGSGGGYVAYAEPNIVRVDPLNTSGHVLAHELGHIHLKTDLGKTKAQAYLNRTNPLKPGDIAPLDNPNIAAGLRHAYELETVPTLIEESSAQGGAYGVLELLGYGDIEELSERQRSESGGFHSSPTAYPNSYAKKFIHDVKNNPNLMERRGDPSWQQELNNIERNIDIRSNRKFKQARDRVLNFKPEGYRDHTLSELAGAFAKLAPID